MGTIPSWLLVPMYSLCGVLKAPPLGSVHFGTCTLRHHKAVLVRDACGTHQEVSHRADGGEQSLYKCVLIYIYICIFSACIYTYIHIGVYAHKSTYLFRYASMKTLYICACMCLFSLSTESFALHLHIYTSSYDARLCLLSGCFFQRRSAPQKTGPRLGKELRKT